MKRGPGPRRRTPLQNKKPLQRAGGPHTGPWPTRSKPIKVKRDKPRRRAAAQDAQEHGLPWPDVRMVIYVRSGGRCELCGVGLNIANMEGHHRRTRRVGPDCPCNALALCSTCHHGDVVHGGPERGRILGLIVSRHSQLEPVDVDVVLVVGRVRLGCDGTYRPAA